MKGPSSVSTSVRIICMVFWNYLIGLRNDACFPPLHKFTFLAGHSRMDKSKSINQLLMCFGPSTFISWSHKGLKPSYLEECICHILWNNGFSWTVCFDFLLFLTVMAFTDELHCDCRSTLAKQMSPHAQHNICTLTPSLPTISDANLLLVQSVFDLDKHSTFCKNSGCLNIEAATHEGAQHIIVQSLVQPWTTNLILCLAPTPTGLWSACGTVLQVKEQHLNSR